MRLTLLLHFSLVFAPSRIVSTESVGTEESVSTEERENTYYVLIPLLQVVVFEERDVFYLSSSFITSRMSGDILSTFVNRWCFSLLFIQNT